MIFPPFCQKRIQTIPGKDNISTLGGISVCIGISKKDRDLMGIQQPPECPGSPDNLKQGDDHSACGTWKDIWLAKRLLSSDPEISD